MSDLVKIARTYVPFQTTHFDGCEREHIECLVQRMADEIERLRAERDALLNALETMLIGACAVGVPHAGERQVLQECVDAARAVIAAARKEQA